MKLREDAQWALVVPTSMGVRLTPENISSILKDCPQYVAEAIDDYFGQPTKLASN